MWTMKICKLFTSSIFTQLTLNNFPMRTNESVSPPLINPKNQNRPCHRADYQVFPDSPLQQRLPGQDPVKRGITKYASLRLAHTWENSWAGVKKCPKKPSILFIYILHPHRARYSLVLLLFHAWRNNQYVFNLGISQWCDLLQNNWPALVPCAEETTKQKIPRCFFMCPG